MSIYELDVYRDDEPLDTTAERMRARLADGWYIHSQVQYSTDDVLVIWTKYIPKEKTA